MEASITIRKYADADYAAYKALFTEYFRQDFRFDITDEDLDKICTGVAKHVCKGIQFLDLLICDGVPQGFIEYQVDSPNSDWCEKEGYGCIREVFIKPELRKHGLGRLLAKHAEENLFALTVPHIYLTSDEAGGFWETMGYRASGEVCEKNKCPVYVK